MALHALSMLLAFFGALPAGLSWHTSFTWHRVRAF
jgi:hypothetical protein